MRTTSPMMTKVVNGRIPLDDRLVFMSGNLRFLTRQACHLCEDALALLQGVPLDIIDIDLDPDLVLVYDERVPVLLDATTGEVLLEGVFAPDAVRTIVT